MMEVESGIVPGEKVLHIADSIASIIFDHVQTGFNGTLSLELDGRNVATLAGAGVEQFTEAMDDYALESFEAHRDQQTDNYLSKRR